MSNNISAIIKNNEEEGYEKSQLSNFQKSDKKDEKNKLLSDMKIEKETENETSINVKNEISKTINDNKKNHNNNTKVDDDCDANNGKKLNNTDNTIDQNDSVNPSDENDKPQNIHRPEYICTSTKDKNNIADINFDEDEKETKEDANEKYNAGDYDGALKIWERGLRTIEYILSKKDDLKKEKIESFQKLRSTYCSNIAQGYMKLNNYSNCVKYSLQALEHDKNNEKIYFRLAKGYYALGEYDKSIKVLQDAIQIKKDLALINLLALVKKKKELHLMKEKFMMKHIFENLKKNPLTNNYDEKENDEKGMKYFAGKAICYLCSLISFITLYVSLLLKQIHAFFNYTLKKSNLKRE